MPESVAKPSSVIPNCSHLLFPHSQVELTVPKLFMHLLADSESLYGLNKEPIYRFYLLLFPMCSCMRETTSEVLIFFCPCGLVRSVCVKAGWIEISFTTWRK